MIALHICLDHNFIENSRKIFNKYYPDQNIFIVNSKKKTLSILNNSSGFKIYNLKDPSNYDTIKDLCIKNDVNNIVLHGMSSGLLPLIQYLKRSCEFKIYWIFWGYELYQLIGYEKNYKLIDSKLSLFHKESYYLPNKISKIIRKIRRRYLPDTVKGLFPYIDYFCFWNKKDYDLLTYFYKYPIKYKYFAYSANCPGENPTNLFPLKNKLTDTIMINHQASLFGNHDTIFSKIKEIDQMNHYTKLVPLSYGSTIIRNNVFKLGNKLFGHKFKPILNYMQRDEYFNMLKSVDIAIFGQRRQEASGNIIQLLKNGVKVFLRNDNNLLEYYRQKGYIVFSFEDDLIDLNSLKSLTLDEKEHNRKCYLSNLVYYDDFMPNFFLEE